MANLLKIPNTAAADVRVIGTDNILTITYPTTSIVRIIYRMSNPGVALAAAASSTFGAMILRCTFSTADATYATHEAFVDAVLASVSSKSNPDVAFVCPALPGARTVAVSYEAPIGQVS